MTELEALIEFAHKLFDEGIYRWNNDPKAHMPAHEYLGLTWEEYAAWVELDYEKLRKIIGGTA